MYTFRHIRMCLYVCVPVCHEVFSHTFKIAHARDTPQNVQDTHTYIHIHTSYTEIHTNVHSIKRGPDALTVHTHTHTFCHTHTHTFLSHTHTFCHTHTHSVTHRHTQKFHVAYTYVSPYIRISMQKERQTCT
jgi:hypothetical protein